MNNASEMLKNYAAVTEKALKGFLPEAGSCPDRILDAASYSLMAGGKRIRPALTMEFYRINSGRDASEALPFACAIEMIHTYSLIHDDLPCMDNDLMRRGKPSCHAAFGEDIALLAGDALLTLAFETAAKADRSVISPGAVLDCISILSRAAGICGMVGGQVLDLEAEEKAISEDELIKLQYGKTGMMIIGASLMGCAAAGAKKAETEAARLYSENIGRVFQMVDDVLDVTADEKLLGKPVGSDKENNKTTFVTLFGIEKTMRMSKELTEQAKEALSVYGNKAENLISLADMLLNRNK